MIHKIPIIYISLFLIFLFSCQNSSYLHIRRQLAFNKNGTIRLEVQLFSNLKNESVLSLFMYKKSNRIKILTTRQRSLKKLATHFMMHHQQAEKTLWLLSKQFYQQHLKALSSHQLPLFWINYQYQKKSLIDYRKTLTLKGEHHFIIRYKEKQNGFSSTLVMQLKGSSHQWVISEGIPLPQESYVRRLYCSSLRCFVEIEHDLQRIKSDRSTYILFFNPHKIAAQLYYLQGYQFHTHKRYQKARQAFQKAILFKPTFGDAIYNLACVYALSKQPKKAIKTLKKAFKYGHYRKLACQDKDFQSLHHHKGFIKFLHCQSSSSKGVRSKGLDITRHTSNQTNS